MAQAPDFERRFAAELRAATGRRLEGYAAVFNAPATVFEPRYGVFRETIRPGAFARSLREIDDILALADHDETRVLARTRSKTLALAEDAKGLHFAFAAPDTQAGSDMLALARRGDLGGASFKFIPWPDGDRWDGKNRELLAVRLSEISLVSAHPAYPQTSVAARSRQPLQTAASRRRFLETL